MSQKVLSYDLGGTKVAVGVVHQSGKILDEVRVPVLIKKGKEAVLTQLSELGNQFLNKHPEIKKVGVASAGPLDLEKGILIDPTNFASSKGSWGQVPLVEILSSRLNRKVFLENDAAAAILAEHWRGAAQGYQNAMILTLGTGLGTGVICNGELVRAGRNLHPEGGHLIVNFSETKVRCNCGNYGCSEAYLSGKNFEKYTAQKLGRPRLLAPEIADLARKGNKKALAAFQDYSKIMAAVIQNFARLYAPEIVVFTGSFARASDLFLNKTKRDLESLMKRQKSVIPKLVISQLENEAGLLGGAYIALQSK